MSHFPYALPKLLVFNGTLKTTGDSGDLASLELGVYNKNTNAVVTTSNEASHPYVYIAQGSPFTVDKIGSATPLLGLKESIKTPGINAKYVTKFYKVLAQDAANHIIQLGGSADVQFEAAKTYRLRVEFKGSPILRTLNRQLYKLVPFFTGCAADGCLEGCSKEYVDPGTVMKGFADYIAADPLLSLFVTAKPYVVAAETTLASDEDADTDIVVTSGTGIAVGQLVQGAGIAPGTFVNAVAGTTVTLNKNTSALTPGQALTFSTLVEDSYVADANSTTAPTKKAFMIIEAAYVDTSFGDCSFHPADFFQKEPIVLTASLVDESGDPCTSGVKINTNTNENASELQAPVTPEGLGETVLREYNLSQEYLGLHFNTDARRREIEGANGLTVIDRTKKYNRYFIKFSVPQFQNFSNTFSNNQYLVSIVAESTVDTSAFETLMTQWLAAHNPAVSLETIS
jgi:hypothetical protein